MTSQTSISISRPWYVYLIALWSFFGVGSFILSVARLLAGGNQSILKFAPIVALIFSIVILVNVIQMKRKFLIIFGVLCILIALWNSFGLISAIHSLGLSNPIIFLLLFYIIPSIAMAAVTLRPKFLNRADQFCKQKTQDSIRKSAIGSL